MGCSPSGTACFSVAPPKGHKSYQEASCHGSAGPCHEPVPAGTAHGLTAASEASTCSSLGALLGLQGNFGFGAWSTSCPSFSTHLDVRDVPLTCSHPVLLCLQLHLHKNLFLFFPSQICYHRGVSTIPDGLSLGQLWVHPGAGIRSAGHEGSFQQLLTEATPIAPLLPQPTCINPTHCDTENRRGTIIL